MDPNAALTTARAALAKARELIDLQQADELAAAAGEPTPTDEMVTDALGESLEHFEALDGWISSGGFLPTEWQLARDQAAAREAETLARRRAQARIPDHLTGSDRPGGGDPLGDYLHLKGEL